MWRRMTAKRDARMVAAMLEEMRLKASSMRNNELSREEVSETRSLTLRTRLGSRALPVDHISRRVVLQVRWRWSSGSWAGLENVMDQEVRGGGEGSGSCEHASQTALGVWGRRTRRANLRRSIGADTLAGSALDSGISVGHVITGCSEGDVWRGPGVKRSHSVTEQLHYMIHTCVTAKNWLFQFQRRCV